MQLEFSQTRIVQQGGGPDNRCRGIGNEMKYVRRGIRVDFKQNQINAIMKKLMANTATKWGMNIQASLFDPPTKCPSKVMAEAVMPGQSAEQ